MFGKKSRVSRLAAQKQLLIAESELNRVQLCREWQSMTDEARTISKRAQSYNGIATSVISMVAAVGVFKNNSRAAVGAKTSWLQKITCGAKLASTVWLLFRPHGSSAEKK